MPSEIIMPALGAEMEEGKLLKWLVRPGDSVKAGDVIADIETDKAAMELTAEEAGTFLKVIAEEGATVPVGGLLAYLGEAGEVAPDAPAPVAGAVNAADMENSARGASSSAGSTEAIAPGDTMHPEQSVNAADSAEPGAPAGEYRATDDPPPAPRVSTAPPASLSASEAATASAPTARAGRTGPAADVRVEQSPELGARPGGRLRASPVARSMAEELGVDLTRIQGSGPEGRIMRRDVEEFARSRAAAQVQGSEARAAATIEPGTAVRPTPAQAQAAPRTDTGPAPATPRSPAPPAQPSAVTPAAGAAAAPALPPGIESSLDTPTTGAETATPLTRMRQAIARRMATAKREMPHYYVALDVDMTEAMALRRTLNDQLPEEERISVNDLILKGCALALERHPHFNASFSESGITTHQAINVGIAVALPDGLIVPAVLDCRGKSLGALARASREVADRARAGRLRPAELNEGTFTVSNLGMYGVETLIAIIQPGQAAILGVGAVTARPVARAEAVVIRQMMTIALSADHRVTDGAQGARFIAEFKNLLEQPMRLLL